MAWPFVYAEKGEILVLLDPYEEDNDKRWAKMTSSAARSLALQLNKLSDWVDTKGCPPDELWRRSSLVED